MELVVELTGKYIVNPFLSETKHHAPNYWPTQLFTCWLFLWVSSVIFYFTVAGSSYLFFFVRKAQTYRPDTVPTDLTQQIRTEIGIAMRHLPGMAVVLAPAAFGVTRGWSKLYYNVDDYGWIYLFCTVPLFLFFTDMLIYYIHRGLHIGPIYKHVHKTHHTYRYTTPFSSHAFHFLDGTAQGCPYFIYIYLFPTHYIMFVVLFIFVNCWTISIHDQVDFTGQLSFVNSTGHHTIHHTEFNYNYGQYFTLWDRVNGTHKDGFQTHDFWKGEKLGQEKKSSNGEKME